MKPVEVVGREVVFVGREVVLATFVEVEVERIEVVGVWRVRVVDEVTFFIL